MKKNRISQIIAFFALFGIIIGIIGTGLLVIFSQPNQASQQLTQEQLQELINAQSGSILKSNSGSILDVTASGSIEIQ